MLLNLKPLIINELPSGMGVVYAGAHHGQCIEQFIQSGFNRILFIDPDPGNCAVIENKMKAHPGIVYAIANCAAGSSFCKTGMYIETHNQGQSNSILKPKLHTSQYPEIIFTESPQGEFYVKKIDDIIKEVKMYSHQFHMLYMDLQGYEIEALKGASELLKSVTYVYSEVSREELYEGCALMPDVEKYLGNLQFELKAIDWSGNTWGDALFHRIKKVTEKENIINKFFNTSTAATPAIFPEIKNGAVVVPAEFRQQVKKPYPEDNLIIFEQYFENFWNNTGNPNEIAYSDIYEQSAIVMDMVRKQQKNIKRIYLPVFWTSYYMNNGYASDKQAMQKLQDFLNTLDPSLKYFTIVQYDDGILNDLNHIDCHILGMGGGQIDSIIPLTSTSRKCIAKPGKENEPRKYIANFIGKITHPVRQQIISMFQDKQNYYISTRHHSIEEYSRIMADSTYTLAPRGYGLSSFRIKEAYEQGSIPVYISDKFLFPDSNKYPGAFSTELNSKTPPTYFKNPYSIKNYKKTASLWIVGSDIINQLHEALNFFHNEINYDCAKDLYSYIAVSKLVIEILTKNSHGLKND